MKVAYFVSQYPARSHTFVRREMDAMRGEGIEVRAYSIRRCPESEVLCDLDRREFDSTWPVLPASFRRLIRAHTGLLLRRPVAYARALAFAFRNRLPGAAGFAYALIYISEAALLADKLQQDEVDRIHVHFGNAGAMVASVAAQFIGVPWGVTYHGASDFSYPTVEMMRWQIVHASFVRCVTYFGMSQAMRQCAQSQWHKLFVCYSGLPSNAFASEPVRASRQAGAPLRVLCVGRLSPEKGQRGLLDALAMLVERGIDAELVLAGDGPDRNWLVGATRELGIADRCRFLGSVPEESVPGLMAECDVLACPSLMEGLPQVLLEAMTARVPVVAPGIAGIPELIADGITGLLFPPANWSRLADCIARIGTDPQLAAGLASAGRERVVKDFGLPVTIRPLLERIRTMR